MHNELYESLPNQEFTGFEMGSEHNQENLESELVHELLQIQSEAELNRLVGNILSKSWNGARDFYNSPSGRMLRNQAISGLKSIGLRALPGLASSVGRQFMGAKGANIGQNLGNMASNAISGGNIPAQTRSRRDRHRRFIRMARRSARRIAVVASNGQPLQARDIRRIIIDEGKKWFPEIFRQNLGARRNNSTIQNTQSRGRWYRQGNRIIIAGL